MDDEVRSFMWPATTLADRGLAVVLPGDGYSGVEPLLYWTSRALTQRGYSVGCAVWPDNVRSKDREDLVESGLESVAGLAREEPILAVGMSTGCLVAHLRPSLACVAFSPITVSGTPASPSRVRNRRSPGLAVRGTGDYLSSSGELREWGFDVLEVEGADHALEIPDDWERSVHMASVIVSRVLAFLPI